MADRKVSPGIYRTRYGWRLFVRVAGRLRPRRIKDPFHHKGLVELKQLRDDFAAELRRDEPVAPPVGTGTFAEDVIKRYLPTRRSMTTFAERQYHMRLWMQEFGTRQRHTIQPWEIRTVLERWLLQGPKRVCVTGGHWIEIAAPLSPSQVTKRQRALQNLWTVLDGRHAYNPVREIAEAEEPEAAARALSYDVVEAILAQMPDRRYERKLTADHAAEISAALRADPSHNKSDLARRYGVSETMIRKIARGFNRETHDAAGLTKLRLRAIAYTGFSHSELMGIKIDDLHLQETSPWVFVKGRAKGKGTTGAPQPLTEEGAAALRALVAANGLGDFQPGSMWKSFRRAWKKLHLSGLKPYDLRHSYASEVFGSTGNLAVTQILMRHRDQRTTLRYAKRAVDPVRMAAITALNQTKGFKGGKLPLGVTKSGND